MSECFGSHKAILDLAVTTMEQDMKHHFGDQIASPAELAKSYMSNRPAKVPSSTLGPLSQTGKSSQLSALPVKTYLYSGVPKNGLTTPRTRGRSAIYNMARTPYSRFDPVTQQKIMQSLGFLGPAFFLSQLSHVKTLAMAMLCMSGNQGLDAFSQSGMYSNHQGVGPRYSGMLVGLSNTTRVLAGVFGTTATRYSGAKGLDDESEK